jgi:hypothetical protein
MTDTISRKLSREEDSYDGCCYCLVVTRDYNLVCKQTDQLFPNLYFNPDNIIKGFTCDD